MSVIKSIFFDPRDKNPEDSRKKAHQTVKNIKGRWAKNASLIKIEFRHLGFFILLPVVLFGMTIFTLTECSFLQIFMRIEFFPDFEQSLPLALTAGLAYFFGTFILVKLKCSDFTMLFIGMTLAIISLIGTFLFSNSTNSIVLFPILFYAPYSISFSFLTPSLFSLIKSKIEVAHCGKLFGLLDSGESAARTLVTIGVLATKNATFGQVLIISFAIMSAAYLMTLYYQYYFKKKGFIN